MDAFIKLNAYFCVRVFDLAEKELIRKIRMNQSLTSVTVSSFSGMDSFFYGCLQQHCLKGP